MRHSFLRSVANKSCRLPSISLIRFFVLFVGVVFSSTATARSNGSITSSSDCSVCHDAGTVVLGIVGPDIVPPDTTHTYTLTITGGPAATGGLNVFAPDGGELSLVDSSTQLIGGEITHTEPKDFSGNTVSWDFQWTAPSEIGFYALGAQGVSANDASGNNGDFSGSTSFSVQVVPVPGAAILFGSALGLLGWIRRRAA